MSVVVFVFLARGGVPANGLPFLFFLFLGVFLPLVTFVVFGQKLEDLFLSDDDSESDIYSFECCYC